MALRTTVSSDDLLAVFDGDPAEYACPVCGVELPEVSFLTPERDYYCPFCSTRQIPSRISAAPAAV